jgi:two-component SAPR family response regulator
LAVAVSTIRGVLDPDRAYEGDFFIKGDTETLRLDLNHLWVDVEQFLLLVAQVLAGDISKLDEAEALYRGDFLEEDVYEDWAQPMREEARALYMSLLRRRTELADQLGVDQGIAARLRILELDPWDEEAHLGLVSALDAAGRHGEARRARRRYASRMAEIGVRPTSL